MLLGSFKVLQSPPYCNIDFTRNITLLRSLLFIIKSSQYNPKGRHGRYCISVNLLPQPNKIGTAALLTSVEQFQNKYCVL